MHSFRRRHALMAAVVASVVSPLISVAGTPVFSASSTVQIVHDPDTGAATTNSYKNVNPPPASSGMPVPAGYQYGKTLTLGAGTTQAFGSIGHITTSTLAGLTLAAGSGVSQTDPSNNIVAASAETFNINMIWSTPTQFGPTAYGYVSFALAGTVDPGGSAQAIVNLTFKNGNTNANLRAPLSQTLTFSSPGAFSQSFLNNVAFTGGSVPAGTPIVISGSISLRATDPSGTCNIDMPRFETSSAPPTAEFTGNAQSNNYFDPNNWNSGGVIVGSTGAVPNGDGVRARFLGGANLGIADNPLTLGTLDIDSADPVTINGQGSSGAITFRAESGTDDTCIFVRNVTGNGAHTINTGVLVSNPLEIRQDSSSPLTFTKTVDGGAITKTGDGAVIFQAANTFGPLTINGGTVIGTQAGALGASPVNIGEGILNYDVNGLASQINVNAGGVVNLGVIANASDKFVVAPRGAIQGSPNELPNLTIGSTGLSLAPGAMIVHEAFSTGPSGNPANLPNTPTYIFGIGYNATGGGAISVGFGSGSPWRGFGSSRGVFKFGTPGSNDSVVNVVGDAELLVQAGQLSFDGALNGGAFGSTLTKTGKGLVAFGHTAGQSFGGTLNVIQGSVAVNSSLPAALVKVDNGATLGGTGTINAPVSLLAGGRLAPGALAFSDFDAANRPSPETTPGTLTVASLAMNSTSHLVYQLNKPGVYGGGINDLLIVNGNVTLAGLLDIDDGIDFGAGQYTLVDATGSTAGALGFGEIPPQYVGLLSISILSNFAGGTSVVLNVAAVPEPTAAALALFATGLLARRKRASRHPPAV